VRFKITIAGMILAAAQAGAQWLNYPAPGVPRGSDGKVNLRAPVQRLPGGRPDLSGVWTPDNVKHLENIGTGEKPLPLLPAAAALFENRKADHGKEDPDANCTLSGVPRIEAVPFPFKILQSSDEVVILYEAFTTFRQVFMDGRSLPPDPQASWMGYSVGKWDGDTLVVETAGFNDETWLDSAGTPHSDALHVTERYHRRDIGHLDIQITLDDPKTFLHPFTVTEHFHLLPDTTLLEFICSENNRDLGHLVGAGK
jgi:hypothetical protein